jgi:MscS family membrane protein
VAAAIASSAGRRVFERLVPGGDVGTVRRAANPLGLLLGAGVARGGYRALGLPPEALAPLLVATSLVGAAAAVLTTYRLVDLFTASLAERARRTPSRADDVLVPLLRKSLKIAVVAFGLVFVADNLDVDISSLLAGLGLGGLAFALAAQDTVKNLFGSVTVLLDKPFQVGDYVNFGGVEGTVEEVGLRSTRLRTPADSLVTVPNSNLISSNVENLGARRWRRWLTRLGVEYSTPPETIEAFCEGIRELIRRSPITRKEGFEVWANEFGASAIEIVVAVYFPAPTWSAELEARHRLLLDVMRLAERLDMSFAFPTRTLHVLRPGESPAPERLPAGGESIRRGRAAAAAISGETPVAPS